ncbi:hypothetical protein A0U87_13485 [Sphingobium sp. MP9-4]|nr:hypothetical protein A0U87_13485 [Sphingobium sp. MP9-4]
MDGLRNSRIARIVVDQQQWGRIHARKAVFRFDRLETSQFPDAFNREELLVLLGCQNQLWFAMAEVNNPNRRKTTGIAAGPANIVEAMTATDIFDLFETTIGDVMIHQREWRIGG